MEEHTQVSTGHKCSDKRHSSNYCLHTAAEFDLRGCSGAAVKYSFEELGSDPKRLLIKGQTNLFSAVKRGDVEKSEGGIDLVSCNRLVKQEKTWWRMLNQI